jgi:predicted PurR-regulated permease PerM
MTLSLLDKSIKILLVTLLTFILLYYGKPFLVPFIIAALLAMLILPLSVRLERKMKKALAILISISVLLVALSIIISVFAWQISDISDKAPQIQKNISEKIQEFRTFATNSLGIPRQQQQKIIKEQQQSSSGKMSTLLTGVFSSFGSFLTNFIIVMVYIFLFLLYRNRFQQFVLKQVPQQEQQNAKEIMHEVRQVAQKYLTGLSIMIVCLWILYSIGFTIAGVDNAIFFAILCGLLEIVPFVGNLIGVSVTLLMSLAQGGETSMIIAILITYAVVQFFQTYLLEPMVVGKNISINPVFTIVGLVGGELLWGLPGMILALPILGIIKIICDRIEPLKPYGFLIGDEKEDEPTIVEKIKKMVTKKK